MAAFPYPVDILVNYNAYADIKAYQALYKTADNIPNLILGSSYAPLRSMFQNVQKREQKKVVKNVLISTGGADFLHLAKQFLQSNLPSMFTYHFLLGDLNTDKEEIRRLVVGRKNIVLHENVSNMKELLSEMDMAVSAAGSTLYEICACGVPLVTYVLVDNQILGAEAFNNLGLGINIGDIRENSSIGVQMILKAIEHLASSYEIRCEIGSKQQQLIDGHGTEKIANIVTFNLIWGKICLVVNHIQI